MTLADRAQGKDSKSEKTRMVMGALSEPRKSKRTLACPPDSLACANAMCEAASISAIAAIT